MRKRQKERPNPKPNARETAREKTQSKTTKRLIKQLGQYSQIPRNQVNLKSLPKEFRPIRNARQPLPISPQLKTQTHKKKSEKRQLDIKRGTNCKSINRANKQSSNKVGVSSSKPKPNQTSKKKKVSEFQPIPPTNVNVAQLSYDSFEYQGDLGKGSYGQVFKAMSKSTQKLYAIKRIRKDACKHSSKGYCHVEELKLLKLLRHPFLAKFYFTFEDHEHVYQGFELLQGGDLRKHIDLGQLTEEQVRFVIASLFLAIEYLHCKKVIHRDIKPENIVFDSRGYLRLIDLGFAQKVGPANRGERCGSIPYNAPEMSSKQSYSYSVDYYAAGIITYELIMRSQPKSSTQHNSVLKQVQAQFDLNRRNILQGWSQEIVDFVDGLIEREIDKRLGADRDGFIRFSEITNHAWFRNFKWSQLDNRTMLSPIKPLVDGILVDQFAPSPSVDSVDHQQQNPILQGIDEKLSEYYHAGKEELEHHSNQKEERRQEERLRIRKASRSRF